MSWTDSFSVVLVLSECVTTLYLCPRAAQPICQCLTTHHASTVIQLSDVSFT